MSAEKVFSYQIYQFGKLIESDKIFASSEEDAINYLRGEVGGEDMDIRNVKEVE